MSESNSQPEKPKDQPRFSQEQYDFLRKCSKKGEEGIEEWNEWRRANPNQDILLDKRDFHGWYLQRALLNTGAVVAHPGGPGHQWVFKGEVYLRGSLFLETTLQGTYFRGAHLQEAMLNSARLDEACLELTHIEGAQFKEATFDKWTSFEGCQIDKRTDFRGADLASLRVSPWIRQLMEYNIKRMNWEEWYPRQNCLLRWVVRAFWWVSDYGISAPRIIGVFSLLAVAFAVIYYLWGLIEPPGIVDYLFVDANGVKVGWGLAMLRALHFSVVIMTVGFTNMHASAHSFWAHILVGFQMILGFVLLGALVTRFAVLFAAGGPAGRFADVKGQKTDDGRQDNKTFA